MPAHSALFLLPNFSLAQKNDNVETRKLDDFSKVILMGHADIYLYPSDKNEIRLEGKKKMDWSQYVTEVKDDKLYVYYKRDKNKNTRVEPKVHIHLAFKDLDLIDLEGKIWIASENTIETENLTVTGEGMIKGHLAVNVQKLKVGMEGMIRMELAGKADVAKFKLEGMGRIDGAKLVARNATTDVEGWGKTWLEVQEEYNASIEGIGSINYTGNPKKEKISKDGITFVREY